MIKILKNGILVENQSGKKTHRSNEFTHFRRVCVSKLKETHSGVHCFSLRKNWVAYGWIYLEGIISLRIIILTHRNTYLIFIKEEYKETYFFY